MRLTASIADTVNALLDALGAFVSNLAAVHWGLLALGLASFVTYLSLRALAYQHIIEAAYPAERIPFRRIWGAYFAAYGFNNVIPARGGDVIRLFLTKTSVPHSSYPAVASSFAVEVIFDAVIGSLVLAYAFSQGVFPSLPEFARLNSFDIAFLASNPQLSLFLLTLAGILVLIAVALLSARVRAFWARVRQGVTILGDRRRYLREVFAVQLAGWGFRFTAFWLLLEAFNVGGSVRNVLLVLGVNAVAAVVPFTPGGAGVQQALLVNVFAGTAAAATVAAYSVGAQIAIAATCFAIGFLALVLIFGIRSFRDVVAQGRAERAADARAGHGAAGERPGEELGARAERSRVRSGS